jgi:hypothetical protein
MPGLILAFFCLLSANSNREQKKLIAMILPKRIEQNVSGLKFFSESIVKFQLIENIIFTVIKFYDVYV